jgi:hypothetical protein
MTTRRHAATQQKGRASESSISGAPTADEMVAADTRCRTSTLKTSDPRRSTNINTVGWSYALLNFYTLFYLVAPQKWM